MFVLNISLFYSITYDKNNKTQLKYFNIFGLMTRFPKTSHQIQPYGFI